MSHIYLAQIKLQLFRVLCATPLTLSHWLWKHSHQQCFFSHLVSKVAILANIARWRLTGLKKLPKVVDEVLDVPQTRRASLYLCAFISRPCSQRWENDVHTIAPLCVSCAFFQPAAAADKTICAKLKIFSHFVWCFIDWASRLIARARRPLSRGVCCWWKLKEVCRQYWEKTWTGKYLETHFALQSVKLKICFAVRSPLFSLSRLFQLSAHCWIRDYSLRQQKVLEQTKYLCGSKFAWVQQDECSPR